MKLRVAAKHIFAVLVMASILLNSSLSFSQGGIGVNPLGNPPDPSSGLDIDFTDKGFLYPRLTTAQRNAINSPASGLLLFNTTEGCLQIYMPITGWRSIYCDCDNAPSAAFTFPSNILVNNVVNFIPQSQNPSYAYVWTFQSGSPTSSTSATPSTTWTTGGTFQVTLNITDAMGCSKTHTETITVSSCPPPLAVSFTNCSATSAIGPTQAQCNTAYASGALNNLVTVTGGKQAWTVPSTGRYRIEAAGAKGGGAATGANVGGLGVIVRGEISLTQGQVLTIVVGQQGANGLASSWGHGGGGGSTVAVVGAAQPLVAAGGGGGASPSRSVPGLNATTNQCGVAGTNGGAGGCGGNGGNTGPTLNSVGQGGGGGGFTTNGQAYTNNNAGGGGFAFLNSNNGGVMVGSVATNYQAGGFGGGAGGTSSTPDGGGGGGGYSGGGGGATYSSLYGGGGGGGSFIDPTAINCATSNGMYNNSATLNGNITNLGLMNTAAHGYVNITLVCP